MIYGHTWRSSYIGLTLAMASNLLLAPVTNWDDEFATIIGVSSGVVAVLLVVTYLVRPLRWFLGETLLLAHVVWLANFIEWALHENVPWDSRARSCGFYLAFAVIALGMHIATRVSAGKNGH